jgi:hypothetical protein
MTIDPRKKYLTLILKWGLEDYIHEVGLNMSYPSYVTTDLYHKGQRLSNPEYLFKFYSPEDYNFQSIEKPYLYFGNPSDFNDTFDCIMSEHEYIKTFLDSDYLANIGVCNFTTKKTNQMWAYYADKNKGFAVKYKNNKLFLPYSDEISIKSHVLYLKNNIPDHPNLINALKGMADKHAPEPVKTWQHQVLFLHDLCRKNQSYKWESEFRVITSRSDLNKRKININPLLIDSIYLGHKMSESNLKWMQEILQNLKHVKVYKTIPNPKKQKLEDVRIKKISEII